MKAATYWKCEDVSHRPVAVEGCSKRDAGHAETHFASSAQSPKGRWPGQRSLKQKEKKAPIGALGRIQYLNVAEGVGFEPTRRSPACRFSRPVPSTTRPSLRRAPINPPSRQAQAPLGRETPPPHCPRLFAAISDTGARQPLPNPLQPGTMSYSWTISSARPSGAGPTREGDASSNEETSRLTSAHSSRRTC